MADTLTTTTTVATIPANTVVEMPIDAANVRYPGGWASYATTTGTGTWVFQIVDSLGHGLPVTLRDTSGNVILGQQLAAASLPVVLTAAQITTLTPPAAITNFANETGGNLATLAGAVSGGKVQSNIAPATSGGLLAYSYIAAASSNQDSQNPKGSAGQLYGYYLTNQSASIRYVKIYNKATGPTSGDTPVLRFMLPGNALGAGANQTFDIGVAFSSGIGIRITTGQADNDTGAATAGDVIVNLLYD